MLRSKLSLIPYVYLIALLIVFAAVALAPIGKPRDGDGRPLGPNGRAQPANQAQIQQLQNPSWQRAGNNIAACCSVRAYDRALSQLEKQLTTTDYDDVTFMGNFYRDWCHWDDALSYYNLALKIAESKQDHKQIAIALNNLGLVYFMEGNTFASATERKEIFERAESAFTRSLLLAKQSGDTALSATVQENYKLVLLENGKDQGAGKLSTVFN